jgi:hypothetical protein
MAKFFPGLFSAADLNQVIASEDVQSALAEGRAYFSAPIPDTMKMVLKDATGLDLSSMDRVPMRWLRGDMRPHVDRGAGEFDNTYLAYLSPVSGEFIVGDEVRALEQGLTVKFAEGLSHETRGTGDEPRLLLGPMGEAGQPVGITFITYFPTQADALAFNNALGYNSNDFVVGDVTSGTNGGFTSWRIASTSSGPANQAVVYTNGQTLAGTAFVDYYYLYPAAPCFLEGTTVLCEVEGKEVYRPIQDIRRGDKVKTVEEGFKPVGLIGHSSYSNPEGLNRVEARLYVCRKCVYPVLTEDLFVTGCHSILVDVLTDAQREATIAAAGKVFVTGKKYRLMAHIDERAEPWPVAGEHNVWHLALDDADIMRNYGIYVNGGLLVESTSIRFLRDKSNMTLI